MKEIIEIISFGGMEKVKMEINHLQIGGVCNQVPLGNMILKANNFISICLINLCLI